MWQFCDFSCLKVCECSSGRPLFWPGESDHTLQVPVQVLLPITEILFLGGDESLSGDASLFVEAA